MKAFIGATDNDWFAFPSRRTGINDEFDYNKYFYTFHGKRLHIPGHKQYQPSHEFLTWHNENIFRG